MFKEFEKRILSSIILIPSSFFIILKGSLLFNLFLLICFIVTSFEWLVMSKKKRKNVVRTSVTHSAVPHVPVFVPISF